MKIRNSFFLAILAVLTLACNNDDINLLSPNDGEQGYLVLTLETPSSLRTTGTPKEDGLDSESEINSLTVALTDELGIVSAVLKPSISNGVTEKFKVALGQHYVYAIVNNNSVVINLNDNIHQVIEVASATDATSGYKGGSFLMVNQRNSSSENAGFQTTLTAINTEKNPMKIQIKVDRVACKIEYTETTPNVGALSTNTGSFINGVEVEGFALLNVNKQFNLVQTWSKNNVNGITLESEVLETPIYSGSITDQFFHNISEYTTLVQGDGGKITSITDNTAGQMDLYKKAPVYTTENRPTIMRFGENGDITAGRGETTGVIYKVQAKNNDENLGTFYRYKGKIYSDLTSIGEENTELSTDDLGLEIPELRTLGIDVYENGIMYYTYFVRDPNAAHQYDDKNYYGVFRNSVYKLAIESISALGDDVPGGGIVDPNTPIDVTDAYLEVSISINPWVLNNINIEF